MISHLPVPVALKINRRASQGFKIVRPIPLSIYDDTGHSPEARCADQIVIACRENVRFLNYHLRRFVQYLTLPPIIDNTLYLAYTVTVKPEAPFTAGHLRSHLAQAGIQTSTDFGFSGRPDDVWEKLGISNGNKDADSFCIACHRYVTILDLEHIIDMFESFFAGLGGEGRYN